MVSLVLVLGAIGAAGFVWWRWEFRERRFDKLIVEVAGEYGVDPCLVKAVMRRESRFDPWVYGRHGEIGLMQVTEGAGAAWARAVGRRGLRPGELRGRFAVNNNGVSSGSAPSDSAWDKSLLWDERVNVEAGTWYLGRGLERWRGREFTQPEVRVALAAAEYNAGYGNVVRWVGLAEGKAGINGKGLMESGGVAGPGDSAGAGVVGGAAGGGGELTVEEFVGGITWPGVRDYVEEVMENWRMYRERREM